MAKRKGAEEMTLRCSSGKLGGWDRDILRNSAEVGVLCRTLWDMRGQGDQCLEQPGFLNQLGPALQDTT